MQINFELEPEMEKLNNRILKMGNLASQQISVAMQALLNGVLEENELIDKTENKIDKLDVKVDKLCQQIVALKQPVASDLRFIMSSLRIGNELERVADIALGIIHRSEIVRQQPEIIKKFNIEQVITKAYLLIQNAMRYYSDYDVEGIKELISECEKLDEKCQLLLDKIIEEMTHDNKIILVATNLILILRHIERLANHTSNIAESIYSMNEGKIVKHGLDNSDTNREKVG